MVKPSDYILDTSRDYSIYVCENRAIPKVTDDFVGNFSGLDHSAHCSGASSQPHHGEDLSAENL